MEKPNIFTFNCTHIIGSLGPNTFEVKQPKCETCGRTLSTEIKYASVEFLFDEYNNEDMFCSRGAIIITEALFSELMAANITGFAPIKVATGKSRHYKGAIKSLPAFFTLGILPPEVENIPLAYKTVGVCPTCKRGIMDSDSFDPELIRRDNYKSKAPLQVKFSSWNQNDIFNLVDHGEAGITEAFLKVMEKFNCPDNIIIPAEWV
jgi:hypothetical protein